MTWKATHRVPPGGLQTFINDQPSTPLDPNLEVEVAEQSGNWARVVASNGWECWVDSRGLLPIAAAAAAAAAVVASGPPPVQPEAAPPAPVQPTASVQPAASTAPAPPASGAPLPGYVPPPQGTGPPPQRRSGPPLVPLLIGVIILLLVIVAAGGGYLFLNANASDVSLEQAGAQSAQPFNPDVTASTDTSPSPSASASPAASPQTAPKGPNGVAIYGGSGNNRVCNTQKLIDFLTSHPSEAAAWAGVEGITTAQIPDFIRALKPQILSQDMRVTNHGFNNGRATTYQSAFQAGTAVLVNQYGYPVVRCLCGNPLTPAVSGKRYHYVGQQWPGFNQTTIIVIVAPPGNVPNVPSGGQQAQPSPSPKLGSVAGNYVLTASNPQGDCHLTATTYSSSVTQNGNQITWNVPSQAGNENGLTLPGTIDPLGHFDLNTSQQGATVSYKGNVDLVTGKWDGTYSISASGVSCSLRLQQTKA